MQTTIISAIEQAQLDTFSIGPDHGVFFLLLAGVLLLLLVDSGSEHILDRA
jgi:hypothetical protein